MKIIATIGVFTEDKSEYAMLDRVSSAVESGINTIRINTANINYNFLETMKGILLRVRDSFPDIKLLIDVPYPKHKPRTNILSDQKPMIIKGDSVVFFCIDGSDYHKYANHYPCVQIVGINSFEQLIGRDEFYYDDGKGSFCIHKVINERCFFASAISDFTLYQNKSLPMASLHPMEGEYFENLVDFILKVNPEILAGSFIENTDEIIDFRNKFCYKNSFMAKIETQKALGGIIEITKEADAIMVARGDLVFNIDVDLFNTVQSKIISTANDLSKPVYIATDILSSLQYRRVPSRADIVDLNVLKECNVSGIILSAFIKDICNAKKYINRIFNKKSD